MLIDYLVGGALAIGGMLALLVFGNDIIRMNTQSREYWQAQNALSDFAGRQLLNDPTLIAPGPLCQGADDGWVESWCRSRQVITLPNACVQIGPDSRRITISWGERMCDGPRTLSVSRRL